MTLFACPPERRDGLETVKHAMGIRHNYLDGWIYLFYENKKFDVQETIAKLQRRDNMEKTVFVNYTITPALKQSMRGGIVQYVGRDKAGRPVLYFNTVRDSPTADQRPERQANMDMFLSWAVRCDSANPTATVTWLINQQDASLMRNTDLIFQKDMALRISKFFPGVVAKMYICNMGSALTFVMRPLLKQLPNAISDCIFLYSAGDIRRGKLLEVIDADVLPVDLGGNNDIDNQQNYERFATTIEGYFDRCQRALRQGLSIKEMEMMETFQMEKDGSPRVDTAASHAGAGHSPARAAPHRGGASRAAHATDDESTLALVLPSSMGLRARRIEEAGEETLDLASPILRATSRIRVDRDDKEAIVIMSSTLRQERGGRQTATTPQSRPDCSNGSDLGASSSSLVPDSSSNHRNNSNSDGSNSNRVATENSRMTFFHTDSQTDLPSHGAAAPVEGKLDAAGLPVLRVDTIAEYSFAANVPMLRLRQEQVWTMQRSWTLFLCHCVTLLPQLAQLAEALCDDDVAKEAILQLNESIPVLRRVMHHALDLFPQTTAPLHYPIFQWLTAGLCKRHSVATNDVPDRVALDCTSPDNFLLSVQGAAVAYVDECERLLEADKMQDRILRRAVLAWPAGIAHDAVVSGLRGKANDLWRQVVPLFQKYIEAKVAMSVGEFIDHYGLLASGGKIDTRAAWYSTLFTGLVQYRELHRRNWLFYVFPPLFRGTGAGSAAEDGAPSIAEMLRVQGRTASLATVSELVLLIERSLAGTREQLGPSAVTKVTSHTSVERYMEDTGTKVYIPYEAQLTGYRPKELVAAEKDSARQLLEAVEQPLKEMLFLSAILFVLEGGGNDTDAADAQSREHTLKRIGFARRQSQDTVESRRGSRRIAIGIAKAAYEVQGTFGGDWLVALPLYGSGEGATTSQATRPDGYGVALALLLLEALVTSRLPQRSPVNESFAISLDGATSRRRSPRQADLHLFPASAAALATDRRDAGDEDKDKDDDSDVASMRSARSAEGVDVEAFLATIAAMDAAATPLANAKRQLFH